MDSLAETNKMVVFKLLDNYTSQDYAGIESTLAEDVSWYVPGSHPLSGNKLGRAAVMAYLRVLRQIPLHTERLILAANDNFVTYCYRGWAPHEEHSLNLNWVLLFELAAGKIQRVEHFTSDQLAVDFFFWSICKSLPGQEGLDCRPHGL